MLRDNILEAVNTNDPVAIKVLVEKKADVNVTSIRGTTALMLSISKKHLEAIKALLESKADCFRKDSTNRTALIRSAIEGEEKAISMLLEKGGNSVDYNHQDNTGSTALMRAARASHYTVVKLLLETEKVDISLKNKKGKTAMMLASPGTDTEKVLREYEEHKRYREETDAFCMGLYLQDSKEPNGQKNNSSLRMTLASNVLFDKNLVKKLIYPFLEPKLALLKPKTLKL